MLILTLGFQFKGGLKLLPPKPSAVGHPSSLPDPAATNQELKEGPHKVALQYCSNV